MLIGPAGCRVIVSTELIFIEIDCAMLTTTTACLIDDQGHAWDTVSSEAASRLRSHFELTGSGEVVAPYGPRTRGCLWIDLGKRFVRIALNPETVGPAAVAEADALLRNPKLTFESRTAFCLGLIDDQSADVRLTEIYASLAQSLNRLKFLVNEGAVERETTYDDRFEAKPLTLALARRTPMLRHLIETWRMGEREVDLEEALPRWRDELEERFTLLEQLSQGCGYGIIEIGKALRIPWHAYVPRLNGAGLLGMPDARYARWASRPYDAVLASGKPRFEEIAALMFWPNTGLVERRYRRLLLPWLDKAGRRLILSVNRPLPGE